MYGGMMLYGVTAEGCCCWRKHGHVTSPRQSCYSCYRWLQCYWQCCYTDPTHDSKQRASRLPRFPQRTLDRSNDGLRQLVTFALRAGKHAASNACRRHCLYVRMQQAEPSSGAVGCGDWLVMGRCAWHSTHPASSSFKLQPPCCACLLAIYTTPLRA